MPAIEQDLVLEKNIPWVTEFTKTLLFSISRSRSSLHFSRISRRFMIDKFAAGMGDALVIIDATSLNCVRITDGTN